MKLIQTLSWVALLIGLLTIGVSYTLTNPPLVFFIILPPLALWLTGERTEREALVNGAFVFIFGLIAVATFDQYNPALLLIATLGTFCAWDLSAFGRRLGRYDHIANQSALLRLHLQTLLAIIAITLTITLIIFNATFSIGLGWSIFFGAILVLGVAQAIRFLRGSDL